MLEGIGPPACAYNRRIMHVLAAKVHSTGTLQLSMMIDKIRTRWDGEMKQEVLVRVPVLHAPLQRWGKTYRLTVIKDVVILN